MPVSQLEWKAGENKEKPGEGWRTEPYRCCFSPDGGGKSLKTTNHCLLERRELPVPLNTEKWGRGWGGASLGGPVLKAPHSRYRQPRFEPWSGEVHPAFTGAVK